MNSNPSPDPGKWDCPVSLDQPVLTHPYMVATPWGGGGIDMGWGYQNVLHNVDLKPIEYCGLVTACSSHTRSPDNHPLLMQSSTRLTCPGVRKGPPES